MADFARSELCWASHDFNEREFSLSFDCLPVLDDPLSVLPDDEADHESRSIGVVFDGNALWFSIAPSSIELTPSSFVVLVAEHE